MTYPPPHTHTPVVLVSPSFRCNPLNLVCGGRSLGMSYIQYALCLAKQFLVVQRCIPLHMPRPSQFVSFEPDAPLLPGPSTPALPRWLAVTLACTFTLCTAAAAIPKLTTPTSALYASTMAPVSTPTIAVPSTRAYPGTAQRQSLPAQSGTVLSAGAQLRAPSRQAALPPRPFGSAPWSAVAAAATTFVAAVFQLRSRQRSTPCTPVEPVQLAGAGPKYVAMAATSGEMDPRQAMPKGSRCFPCMTIRTRFRRDYDLTYPKFMKTMEENFPGAMPEIEFLAKTTKVLNEAGLNKVFSLPPLPGGLSSAVPNGCRWNANAPTANNSHKLMDQPISNQSQPVANQNKSQNHFGAVHVCEVRYPCRVLAVLLNLLIRAGMPVPRPWQLR